VGELRTPGVELPVGEVTAAGRLQERSIRVVRATRSIEVGKCLDQRATG
jgi:hypothetical protein